MDKIDKPEHAPNRETLPLNIPAEVFVSMEIL